MKTESFVLPPATRIKVNIPSGMTVIDPAKPRLASTGKLKVTTVAVHERGEVYLSARTMLRRTRKANETPIDSVEDLEEVLTRGLSVNGDYLVTGIILRGSYGSECVLCLYRGGDRWIVDFSWFVIDFLGNYRVLCLGNLLPFFRLIIGRKFLLGDYVASRPSFCETGNVNQMDQSMI